MTSAQFGLLFEEQQWRDILACCDVAFEEGQGPSDLRIIDALCAALDEPRERHAPYDGKTTIVEASG